MNRVIEGYKLAQAVMAGGPDADLKAWFARHLAEEEAVRGPLLGLREHAAREGEGLAVAAWIALEAFGQRPYEGPPRPLSGAEAAAAGEMARVRGRNRGGTWREIFEMAATWWQEEAWRLVHDLREVANDPCAAPLLDRAEACGDAMGEGPLAEALRSEVGVAGPLLVRCRRLAERLAELLG